MLILDKTGLDAYLEAWRHDKEPVKLRDFTQEELNELERTILREMLDCDYAYLLSTVSYFRGANDAIR